MAEIAELDHMPSRLPVAVWQAWQQSKKVAVPDGGVNLNKFDLLRKMHNIRDLNNGDYYSDEIEENICAVEAMIEAQEN